MATFFLDLEGGNDANDGTTFANRWKTITSGATAARIAPGDLIRVMGSPAHTSLGINGKWTSGPMPATKALASSTNATPIAVTVTGHGYSTGDTVQILSHTTNTNANGVWEITVTGANTFTLDGSVGNGVGGASGTVRNINCAVVQLASALTANITACESAWTASASVTATLNSADYRENKGSASVAVASGFITGKAAYFATGTLNLSTYQQVSFWIKQTSGTVAIAGDVSVRLCTDTIGAVSVHTVAIPALAALNRWVPVTIDFAGNLNSAIASVALYVDTDRGAQTFLIDNIIACKASSSADSITLTSLIGKNADDGMWWPIQSINGTRIVLDQNSAVLPGSQRGYFGTSQTVTTYKKETIKPAIIASGNTLALIQDSGTAGSLIAFEGGYDRVAMTTQNLDTAIDGRNGFGTCIDLNSKSYIRLNLFSFVRYDIGLMTQTACVGQDFDHISMAGIVTLACLLSGQSRSDNLAACVSAPISFATSQGFSVSGTVVALSATAVGITAGKSLIDNATTKNCGNTGCNMSTAECRIRTLDTQYNASRGVQLSIYCTIDFLTSDNNVGGGLECSGLGARILGGTVGPSNSAGSIMNVGQLAARNVTFSDATMLVSQTTFGVGRLTSENHGGAADDHRVYVNGGLIFSQTTTRHTGSGIAWSLQPVSANRYEDYPLSVPLGPFLVEANTLVTVTCWFYRDDVGLSGRLVCNADQLSGMTVDVSDSMSGSAGAWEQLSLSFTPTESGAVWVEAQFFGGTTYTGTIDDFEVVQGSNVFELSSDDAVLGLPFVWNNAQAGGGGGPGTAVFSPFASPVIGE